MRPIIDLAPDEFLRLSTAKASRVGTAALGQWYGQSYSSTNPGWGAGASLENLEVVRDVSGATDYAYQGDRATSLSGAMSASLTYDYAGRAVTRTAGTAVEVFTHDALDRLVKVGRGTTEELLEYGPTGEPVFRKLGTRGTWYVGSVGTVTADVAAGCKGIDVDLVTLADRCSPLTGTVKVAAHVQVAGGRVASINAAAGAGQDPVASVLYYHRDLQGSVVATTMRTGGLSGAMGARYRYTPYGQLDRTENVTATTDSELGYTGGLRLGYVTGSPQVGSLLLLGARVYQAELKRWLVPDTVDGRRYTYAGGDPINFVDPSGRAANAIVGDGGSVGGGGGGIGRNGAGPTGIMLQLAVMGSYPSCSPEYVKNNPGGYCTNEYGEVVSGLNWYSSYMVTAIAGSPFSVTASYKPPEVNPDAWNNGYASDRGVAVPTLSPMNMYDLPDVGGWGGGVGGDKYSLSRTIAHLNSHAAADYTGGTGNCARYVREAINAGRPWYRPMYSVGLAKDFGGVLMDAGFALIAFGNVANGFSPRTGDVMLLDTYPGQRYGAGHMMMFNGAIWVSDYRQTAMHTGDGFLGYNVAFTVYRGYFW